MNNNLRMEYDAFKLFARNMHTETYNENGELIKVYDKVVEVVEGELNLGSYKCVYICDNDCHDVDISSEIEEHTLTELVSPATGTVGDSNACSGYRARVIVIEKSTHYNTGNKLPLEGSNVTEVELI